MSECPASSLATSFIQTEVAEASGVEAGVAEHLPDWLSYDE